MNACWLCGRSFFRVRRRLLFWLVLAAATTASVRAARDLASIQKKNTGDSGAVRTHYDRTRIRSDFVDVRIDTGSNGRRRFWQRRLRQQQQQRRRRQQQYSKPRKLGFGSDLEGFFRPGNKHDDRSPYNNDSGGGAADHDNIDQTRPRHLASALPDQSFSELMSRIAEINQMHTSYGGYGGGGGGGSLVGPQEYRYWTQQQQQQQQQQQTTQQQYQLPPNPYDNNNRYGYLKGHINGQLQLKKTYDPSSNTGGQQQLNYKAAKKVRGSHGAYFSQKGSKYKSKKSKQHGYYVPPPAPGPRPVPVPFPRPPVPRGPAQSPTQPPQTLPPIWGNAQTASPTNERTTGESVSIGPFSVLYQLGTLHQQQQRTPTEQEYDAVSAITMEHIEASFASFFQHRNDVDLLDFIGYPVGTSATYDPTVKAVSYEVTAVFSQRLQHVPGQADLGGLVHSSLSMPSVMMLLSNVRNLPDANPFASTMRIAYSPDGSIGGGGSAGKALLPYPPKSPLHGVFNQRQWPHQQYYYGPKSSKGKGKGYYSKKSKKSKACKGYKDNQQHGWTWGTGGKGGKKYSKKGCPEFIPVPPSTTPSEAPSPPVIAPTQQPVVGTPPPSQQPAVTTPAPSRQPVSEVTSAPTRQPSIAATPTTMPTFATTTRAPSVAPVATTAPTLTPFANPPFFDSLAPNVDSLSPETNATTSPPAPSATIQPTPVGTEGNTTGGTPAPSLAQTPSPTPSSFNSTERTDPPATTDTPTREDLGNETSAAPNVPVPTVAPSSSNGTSPSPVADVPTAAPEPTILTEPPTLAATMNETATPAPAPDLISPTIETPEPTTTSAPFNDRESNVTAAPSPTAVTPTMSPAPVVSVSPVTSSSPAPAITQGPTTGTTITPTSTASPTTVGKVPTSPPASISPSIGGTSRQPITAPPNDSATEAPTPLDNDIPSNGFIVNYVGVNQELTEDEGIEAITLTCVHLRRYFNTFFSTNVESNFVDFSCSGGEAAIPGQAAILYDVRAIFSENSELIPTQAEVDILIQTALLPPEVDSLLEELQALPPPNPLSRTSSVVYTSFAGPGPLSTQWFSAGEPTYSPNEPKVASGLLAALVLSAVFTATIFLVVALYPRRKRNPQQSARLLQQPFESGIGDIEDDDDIEESGCETRSSCRSTCTGSTDPVATTTDAATAGSGEDDGGGAMEIEFSRSGDDRESSRMRTNDGFNEAGDLFNNPFTSWYSSFKDDADDDRAPTAASDLRGRVSESSSITWRGR